MSATKPYITVDLIDEFLYTTLKDKGFSIDVDDYVVAAQIASLAKNRVVDVDRIKYTLASLICRTATEQQQFYHLFDVFLSEKEELQNQKVKTEEKIKQEVEEIKRAKAKRKKLFVITAALAFAAVVFFLLPFSKTNFITSNDIDGDLTFAKQHITVNQITAFSIKNAYPKNRQFSERQTLFQKIFKPRLDTSGIKANWNLQDTLVNNQLAVNYAFKKAGIKQLNIQLSNKNGFLKTFKDSIVVCEPSPLVTFNEPIHKGLNTTFNIKNPQNKAIVWFVDDKEVIGRNDGLSFTFDSAKVYKINCRYSDQYCPHPEEGTFEVVVTDREKFSLTNSQSGNIKPKVTKQLKSLFYWLFNSSGFLLIACIATLFAPGIYKKFVLSQFNFYKKIYKKRETEYLKEVEPLDFSGHVPPLDIAFNNKNKLIRGKESILELAYDLRRKVESDQYYLNLKKTSLATIRNLGMFTPVLQNKSSKRNYLVLIDKTNEKNISVKLFQFLVNQLADNLVELDIYYYHRNPLQVFKKHIDDAINIDYLKNQYHQSVLIVFGNGYNFLNSNFPEIDRPVESTYSTWPFRMLITPNPVMDWSVEEKILASFFHVLPADNKGLLGVIELLLKKEYAPNKKVAGYKNYTAKFVEFEDIDELEAYISNPEVFQWLAALALYPKITWEIIISIGDDFGENLITYENLLKIGRIGWVQKGFFPSRIRLELLKKLKNENEILARNALIHLLEEDAAAPPDSFAYNEKNLQLTINKFVLYTYNPVKYAVYQTAEKAFLKLYNSGKLRDIPLSTYLKGIDPDKKSDAWENTLRKNDNQVDNLRAYSNEKLGIVPDEEIKRNIKRSLVLATAILSLLFVSLTIVGFVKPNISKLINIKSETIEKWKIVFQKDSCYENFNPARLMVAIGADELINTSIAGKDSIQLNNLAKFAGKNASFKIISVKEIEASALIMVSGSQINLQIVGNCAQVPAILPDTITPGLTNTPVYLQYEPDKLIFDVERFQRKITPGYLIEKGVNIDIMDKSEINYSKESDREKALNLAIIASEFFKQDIKAIKVKSTLNNSIMLWILKRQVSPPSVYIQYYPESFKEQASLLLEHLREQGNKVNIGLDKKNSVKSEVRFYFEEDRLQAEKLAKTTAEYLNQSVAAVLVEKYAKNQIEIWVIGKPEERAVEENTQQIVDCQSSISERNATIYFKSGDKSLIANSQNILDQLTKTLMGSPGATISLRGYSNAEKTAMSNAVVAKGYADAVKTYLVSQGVSSSAITIDASVDKGIDTKNRCGNKVAMKITIPSTQKESNKMPATKYK